MLTPNSKLSDYFLRVPKCEEDGSNWSVYKNRLMYAADAATLGDHLSLTYTASVTPAMSTQPTATETAAQQASG
ncbi:hypothetical protein B0H19DRAFT_1250793 [Mycena capillaripes]|nr:hypothetical protein B0H19DRAFT_1250793 [Mycena capillaripes]